VPDRGTASTRGARAHARAQDGAEVPYRPTVPARDAELVDRDGEAIDPSRLLWDEVLGPGAETSKVVPRGAIVRLVDLTGDGCANVLLYNASQPVERLNVADTVKVQWQAYLGPGSLLLSDMGRVLATIVTDTSANHDTLCGASTLRSNEARYGTGAVSGPCPNARDRFAVALAKHGLDRRDIVPNVNFFKGVRVDPDGTLRFVAGAQGDTGVVELRAELPLLIVIANTPHVLDPRTEYRVGPLRVSAWTGDPTGPSDPEWSATPEATRAFLQTEEFLLGEAPR
jgi:uncharacterized protein